MVYLISRYSHWEVWPWSTCRDGIQSQHLGPLVTYTPHGRKSARCILKVATLCICLELPQFWFPQVILLPQSCLEKSLLLQVSSQKMPLMLPKFAAFCCRRGTFSGPHLVPWTLTLCSFSDCYEVLLRLFHEFEPLHLFCMELQNQPRELLEDRPHSLPSIIPVLPHQVFLPFILCHLPSPILIPIQVMQ